MRSDVVSSAFKGIPVVSSGEKHDRDGVTAIKNGVKRARDPAAVPRGDKPAWLRVKVPGHGRYVDVKDIVREHRLSTVCEESMCPNLAECWSHGTATIMVMGSVCTRVCRFCAVDTGNPRGKLDAEEPANTARAVQLMGLRYVVLTSVDRDDLPDGGAAHYAACVVATKDLNPDTKVEALTPDFRGNPDHVRTVVESGVDVYAQNLETVRRLTHEVRDRRAGYEQTLDVLAGAKSARRDVITKTSLMLGLGETEDEILQTLDDLRSANVDIVTFGQYLRPTVNHLPVQRYVPPEDFARYRQWGLDRGFLEVVSGPLVRSSYRADRVFDGNNAGL
ncbi:MAG: lipoyl synthase [Pseudomonadota bacterium]|nr:lipoyl synthase [Pseudomonadota bacterium]